MDTEFPGVIEKIYGDFEDSIERQYHCIKTNVDACRLIQVGFTFFDVNGDVVHVDHISTLQFNLKWNLQSEPHSTESIQLLRDGGFNFAKLRSDGVDSNELAEALIGAGLLLNDQLTWITFHSVYDFAYLMKLCNNWTQMPDKVSIYERQLNLFFPRIVDLKCLMCDRGYCRGGLQTLADSFHVKRKGTRHQAGSDSLLTGETYFQFVEMHYKGILKPELLNLVFGFNHQTYF